MLIRSLTASVAVWSLLAMTPISAAAQDLFELEVFEYGTTPPGDFEVALHTNVLSSRGVAAESTAKNHQPAHLSVEVTRGWTDRFESALFIQTAPFGPAGSARFGGGHLRGKIRLAELPAVPLRIAVSGEYAFNRTAFDNERQTLEARAILDYVRGRLSLIANPSLEVVTRGAEEGLEPVFDVSARAAWQAIPRAAMTVDYFSAAATTRHLQPETGAHHLVFGGLDMDMGSGWELAVGAGHCVTRKEPWLVRSVIGFSF